MKRFALILILFASLMSAGIFFLRSQYPFWMEKVKFELERRLESRMGRKVRIAKLALLVKDGFILKYTDLAIDPASENSILTSPEGGFELNWGNINSDGNWLHKIIILQPKIHLIRHVDGIWNLFEKDVWVTKPEQVAAASRFPKFTPDTTQWHLKNGSLLVQDYASDKLWEFRASQLMGFAVTEEDAKSILLKGEAVLGADGEPDRPKVVLEGTYAINESSFDFVLNDIAESMVINGTINDFPTRFLFSGNFQTQQMDLGTWWQARVPAYQRYISGVITSEFDGIFEGMKPEQIMRSMAGKGAFDIRDGAIKNLNLVRYLIENVKSIDCKRLLSKEIDPLHQEYLNLLNGSDTPFEIVQSQIQAHQGRFILEQSRIKGADYFIEGDGSVDPLNGDIDMRSKLVFSEKLSTFVMQECPDTVPLKHESGRLVIPFIYRGLISAASILPDENFVVTQIRKYQQALKQKQEQNELSELLASEDL